MKTLIEQIWDEEYKPASENVLYGEEIMYATRLLDKQERELWEALGEKEREMFDKVLAHYYDMVGYYKKDAFVQGARLAGRIMKEIEA